MNSKELTTGINYCDPTDFKRGFYVRNRARTRPMTVEVTRNEDGSFVINSAKLNYNVNGVQRQVTANTRELTKDLVTAFDEGRVSTH